MPHEQLFNGLLKKGPLWITGNYNFMRCISQVWTHAILPLSIAPTHMNQYLSHPNHHAMHATSLGSSTIPTFWPHVTTHFYYLFPLLIWSCVFFFVCWHNLMFVSRVNILHVTLFFWKRFRFLGKNGGEQWSNNLLATTSSILYRVIDGINTISFIICNMMSYSLHGHNK